MTTNNQVDETNLETLDGFPFPVLMSKGGTTRALAVAELTKKAMDWLVDAMGYRPAMSLFVVGPEDWSRVASIELYGMPHEMEGRVVVGLQPAEFWSDFIDKVGPQLSSADRQRLQQVYGEPPDLGGLFSDLVVVHELTHLFHDTTEAVDFPRLWLAELFANIGLHGYIASCEPDRLDVLETICQVSWPVAVEMWPVRDLDRMEDSLSEGPLNYVWFQFGLLLIAAKIWEAGGVGALGQFSREFRRPELDNAQILRSLADIDASVGKSLREWPA